MFCFPKIYSQTETHAHKKIYIHIHTQLYLFIILRINLLEEIFSSERDELDEILIGGSDGKGAQK